MIDHVLGRPSVKFRKYQVFTVVALWSLYLYKGDKHGPPFVKRISEILSRRLTAWQLLVTTLIWMYIGRNFGKLVGLESPEPLANLYTRSYFRATWVTTALDAGFWTAMRIKPKWVRDILSMVFSVYYLGAAEQADEKVRKVRGMLTVEHLRVSWNKPETPYLRLVTSLMRPRFMHYKPRQIRIARPRASAYKEPVMAWLYYDGPLSDLKKHDKLILDIPGGGFVAMNPRIHDDKLMGWAGKTGLPVLALDYKKAPEHPYPYALNECYDVYHMLITSRGRCVGMSGEHMPRIIVSGDSAGGNLATAMLLMILQSSSSETSRWMGAEALPLPEAVILIYPALDCNIGNWMTDEQMALINDRHSRKAYRAIFNRKNDDYNKLTPETPHHSDSEEEVSSPPTKAKDSVVTVIAAAEKAKQEVDSAAGHVPATQAQKQVVKKAPMKTRLAMSSMISYFNDRILTPEMMRAMIILYVGPHNRPDFSTDFLLSPVLAPESLLANFPKTYILTGERDPLVDDTVIFAGRLRAVHRAKHHDRMELGLVGRESRDFRESDVVEVTLVPGISHGFLQFPGVFPDGWKYIHRCSEWMIETFNSRDVFDDDVSTAASTPASARPFGIERPRSQAWDGRKLHHFRRRTDSSGEDDRPLEMTRASPPNSASNSQKTNGHAKGSIQSRRQNSRRKSLVSLASEDDLLSRRMQGLAGGLMGDDDDTFPMTP